MSCDQKVVTTPLFPKDVTTPNHVITPKWRIAKATSIRELFLLPKFDKSSPSLTGDKEISQSHMIMR